jgi:hypothetical protein
MPANRSEDLRTPYSVLLCEPSQQGELGLDVSSSTVPPATVLGPPQCRKLIIMSLTSVPVCPYPAFDDQGLSKDGQHVHINSSKLASSTDLGGVQSTEYQYFAVHS